jgi:hypothetical protein
MRPPLTNSVERPTFRSDCGIIGTQAYKIYGLYLSLNKNFDLAIYNLFIVSQLHFRRLVGANVAWGEGLPTIVVAQF